MRHNVVRTLVLVLSTALAARSMAASPKAAQLYKEGQKAERAGEMARAYLLYSEAAAMQPGKRSYWLRSQAVRSRAALQAKPQPKRSDLPLARFGDPASEEMTPEDRAEARKPLPPTELQPNPGRKDFNLQGDARVLFEQVARAFGLDTVFDGDYQAGASIRFRMEQADYREALHALETATVSFIVPLSARLFIVVKDTTQKRAEMEPSVAVSISIPQPVALPEAVELARAVQQAMNIERLVWDSQTRMVVLRDRISKVVPALQVLEDLLYHRPQVEVEMDFLEVNRNDMLSYGLDMATSFPLVNLSSIWNNRVSIPSGVARLAVFGGGKTMFGLGIGDAELIARMSRSTARTLLRTQLRSVEGQPATFHVGDKYPILTAGYYGPIDPRAGQIYRPPPSFNFEDLGLVVKVTPRIHGMEEVSLDVEAEFKVLAGQSLNGIPVISNRKMNSRVRLKNGEWAVVAGMLNASEAHAVSGLAGLSSVPLLGALVKKNTKTRDATEVLLILKPRLIDLPPDQVVTRTLRVGSDTRPVTPL